MGVAIGDTVTVGNGYTGRLRGSTGEVTSLDASDIWKIRVQFDTETKLFHEHELTKVSTGVDMVNEPPHYRSHPSGVEVIEITRHENFNLGNAIKYILRCDLKGNPIEDLKKAAYYLQDEIARRENG